MDYYLLIVWVVYSLFTEFILPVKNFQNQVHSLSLRLVNTEILRFYVVIYDYILCLKWIGIASRDDDSTMLHSYLH